MTTAQQGRDLASRCEEATGPDRELDLAIWRLSGDIPPHSNPQWEWHELGKLTASLDAIMRLCHRAGLLLVQLSDIAVDGLPGALLCSDTSTTPPKEHWGVAQSGDGALARALCAAYCKARAETADE